MYNKLFIYILGCLSLVACTEKPNVRSVSPEDVKAVIYANMNEQQTAWNNADLEGFMKHYWHSDSLVFVGKSGLNKGWQTTLDNYKKGYPDKNAMGELLFTNKKFELLDDSNAYVIGKWELFRIADTLSGHYSLLWKKMNDNWVIVADHSS
ncbi:MAG: DUF4440 domain-containing protein [Flavobacteriales bacterium]